MRPLVVVETPPSLHDELCVGQRAEQLHVQVLIPETRVEALRKAVMRFAAIHGGATRHLGRRLPAYPRAWVLPRATRVDVLGLHTLGSRSSGEVTGDELWPVVAAQKRRGRAFEKHLCQNMPHIH